MQPQPHEMKAQERLNERKAEAKQTQRLKEILDKKLTQPSIAKSRAA
jgi:hypothetical protein